MRSRGAHKEVLAIMAKDQINTANVNADETEEAPKALDPVSTVVKLANTRPDDEVATKKYEAAAKKLGSRVTKRQVGVIEQVITEEMRGILLNEDNLDGIARYADTGDKGHLTPEQNEALGKLVAQAREWVSTQDGINAESQARRIWPRKVAAILLGMHLREKTAA